MQLFIVITPKQSLELNQNTVHTNNKFCLNYIAYIKLIFQQTHWAKNLTAWRFFSLKCTFFFKDEISLEAVINQRAYRSAPLTIFITNNESLKHKSRLELCIFKELLTVVFHLL